MSRRPPIFRLLTVPAMVVALAAGPAMPDGAAADIGDTLYVQKNNVNLRRGPGTNYRVITRLNKGYQVIEYGRIGEWVSIGPKRPRRNRDGWVHSSLLGAKKPR